MSSRSRMRYYRKMMEYNRAEDTLEDKLEIINSNIRDCDDSFADFPNVYNSNENVEGQVIDNFNEKSKKFGKELKVIIDKAKESRDVIDHKKILAHERYLYYKKLYEEASDHDDD